VAKELGFDVVNKYVAKNPAPRIKSAKDQAPRTKRQEPNQNQKSPAARAPGFFYRSDGT
jgi:hypothetical protein